MCVSLRQTITYVFHLWAVEDFYYAMLIEIAQHVGVASTTGFDIALGIDMQASPGCRTVEIAHVVFTCPILQ